MGHYLIEFRLGGYAKKYSQKLIFELVRKFRIRGMKDKVSHISLFGPFNTNNERQVVSIVQNVCKSYKWVAFKFSGFNYFNNPTNKVIYLDIKPSDDLRNLRYELANKLLSVTKTDSSQDRKSANDFYFHSTIAFKDIDNKFNQIWNYLKHKQEPNINQYLLRVTIIKKGRILYEYDLLQGRLLNRNQSLNRRVFQETVRILREGKKDFHKHMQISKHNITEIQTQSDTIDDTHKKKSILDKILLFFRGKI